MILNLFNTVFESGYFPESWAEGFIIPIHKKGDRNDVSNYTVQRHNPIKRTG